jgi:hypothetical protein
MLAKIYRPSKTAMQSGKAGSRQWVLEFDPETAPPPDALMGWTGSSDTRQQIRLWFDSKDAALSFARQHKIPHQVQEPQRTHAIIKAYGDNFAFRRREPWSH